ncbi:acyltransferase family protein [Rhodanobacter aciditrophus]|uniref:Acyltransferase family protein n=1 Tax=Rhodanobacter aciditrophus TaxID=1623218 RepID=A0ABW4B195_9GAMM
MPSLTDLSQSKDNNFNLLRMVCALGVLWAHSILVYTGEPLPWQIFHIRLDHLFVAVFFAISGFLICRSLLVSQDLKRYAIARMVRLFPALCLVVAITVLIVGPSLSTLLPSEYFSHPNTWQYWQNLNLLSIHTQFDLPKVFSNAPFPNNVNASLWTLPIEVWLYVMTAMAYCLIHLIIERWPLLPRQHPQSLMLTIGLVLLIILSLFGSIATQHRNDDAGVMLVFVCVFFAGALSYLARRALVLNLPFMLGLWLVALVLQNTPLWLAGFCLSLVYSVLWLAYRPNGVIRRFNRLGDYSYGTYIYGFMIQQSTLAIWPTLSFSSFLVISTMVTLMCAVGSWHGLEKPFIRHFKLSSSDR